MWLTCGLRGIGNRRTKPLTSGSGWIAVYRAVSSTTMIAATAEATLAPNEATGPSSFDGLCVYVVTKCWTWAVM